MPAKKPLPRPRFLRAVVVALAAAGLLEARSAVPPQFEAAWENQIAEPDADEMWRVYMESPDVWKKTCDRIEQEKNRASAVVSGTVYSLGTDDGGVVYVLVGPAPHGSFRCRFGDDAAAVSKLRPGRAVKIKGIFEGVDAVGGRIFLHHCQVMP